MTVQSNADVEKLLERLKPPTTQGAEIERLRAALRRAEQGLREAHWTEAAIAALSGAGTPDATQITPAMIQAGVQVVLLYFPREDCPEEVAEVIFEAMTDARRT